MNSPSSFYSTIRLNRNKVLSFAAVGNLNDIASGSNGARVNQFLLRRFTFRFRPSKARVPKC